MGKIYFKQKAIIISGCITNNLLDGRIASDYYSNVNAGDFIVYPMTG